MQVLAERRDDDRNLRIDGAGDGERRHALLQVVNHGHRRCLQQLGLGVFQHRRLRIGVISHRAGRLHKLGR